MGIGIHNQSYSQSNKTQKTLIFCNYVLLGAASSCIFLTISLRLVPSIVGLFFILLHVITIAGSVAGSCGGSHRWYAFHLVATVLTAIFQGSVAILIFTTTENFLQALKSYVRTEDGAVILKLAGSLCVLMFCLEWVVMTLAFLLRNDDAEDGNVNVNAKADDLKNYPWPFQV